MTVRNSVCAEPPSSSIDEAAALIEVSGVLNSCARASSSIDFIASFCRAASIRLAAASARDRSIAIAARFAIACTAVSEMEPPGIATLPTGSRPRLSGNTDNFDDSDSGNRKVSTLTRVTVDPSNHVAGGLNSPTETTILGSVHTISGSSDGVCGTPSNTDSVDNTTSMLHLIGTPEWSQLDLGLELPSPRENPLAAMDQSSESFYIGGGYFPALRWDFAWLTPDFHTYSKHVYKRFSVGFNF